jgi:hypothetical protein
MDDGHILLGTILQPVKEREGKKKGEGEKGTESSFLLKNGPTSSHYE